MSQANDFTIISKLGEGSFSSVYKVKRNSDGKYYAMKKIKIINLSSKEKQNALNEIRFLASIRSSYIVEYKEAFFEEDSQILYLIIEYLGGGDLYQYLKLQKKKNFQLSEHQIWNYSIQMIRGLQDLHALGVLHRDIKSANIFLSEDEQTVKIGDLNVSKVAKMGLLYTQTGTPYYASPEVWQNKPYDLKSDIWSLGCVIYEMCQFRTPFKAPDMDTLFKTVLKAQYEKISENYSDDLHKLIQICLYANSHKRPDSQQLLNYNFMKQKINEISNLMIQQEDGQQENQLLDTFYFPSNSKNLSQILPNQKYLSNLSQQTCNQNQILIQDKQPIQLQKQSSNPKQKIQKQINVSIESHLSTNTKKYTSLQQILKPTVHKYRSISQNSSQIKINVQKEEKISSQSNSIEYQIKNQQIEQNIAKPQQQTSILQQNCNLTNNQQPRSKSLEAVQKVYKVRQNIDKNQNQILVSLPTIKTNNKNKLGKNISTNHSKIFLKKDIMKEQKETPEIRVKTELKNKNPIKQYSSILRDSVLQQILPTYVNEGHYVHNNVGNGKRKNSFSLFQDYNQYNNGMQFMKLEQFAISQDKLKPNQLGSRFIKSEKQSPNISRIDQNLIKLD